MEFRIRDDIEIKSLSFRKNEITTYTSEDTARLVSYFLSEINKITDLSKPIGVKHGLISHISACCMLALIKSGRDYGLIYYKTGSNRENADVHFSHIFELGPLYTLYSDDATIMMKYEAEGLSHPIETDLTFRFSEAQTVYALSLESDVLEILTNTGKIEESAVKAAMEHYFSEDDFCVFSRPLRHVGVATLCIYPALFKAKGIAFCREIEDWKKLYHLATHVHMGYDMMTTKFPLPQKLRMLTTGGYDFNKDFIEYAHLQSEIENIVDCYGTRNYPPPMAIRHLRGSNYPIPFKWINEYIKPKFENNWLYLSDDELTFKGTDYQYKRIDTVFAVDDNTFHLLDISTLYKDPLPEVDISTVEVSEIAVLNKDIFQEIDVSTLHENFLKKIKKEKLNAISNIRMNHQNYSDNDFVDFVSRNSNLNLKLAYHHENGHFNPKILVNANELDDSLKFVKDNDIEAVIYIKYDVPQ